MLRRKRVSLFFLLFPFFALCTATGAVAADCSGSAAFTCSSNVDGWVVKIAPGTGVHAGQFPVVCDDATDTSPSNSDCLDKRGNPITGYRFAYDVYAPWGGNLVQADLLASICSGNPITKTYPTDQSVKFLATDPNTGYAGGTSDFVIAWSALKLDPSNHTNIAVYTTKAGAGGQGMQLQTGTGVQYINNILGPVCCVSYAGVPTERIVDNTKVNYNSCTGEFASISTSDSSSITQVPGLYSCWSTGAFDSRQCGPIKRLGPASGAYLDVSLARGYPGDPYTGTRYYGYGKKFYKQSISGTIPGDCQDTPGGPSLVEDSITFGNEIVIKYKKCGDIDSVTYTDGTPATKVNIWIYEADSHGRMTDTGGLLVNSGPRNGAIIDDQLYGTYGGWGYTK
jgi:hypothetical protein